MIKMIKIIMSLNHFKLNRVNLELFQPLRKIFNNLICYLQLLKTLLLLFKIEVYDN